MTVPLYVFAAACATTLTKPVNPANPNRTPAQIRDILRRLAAQNPSATLDAFNAAPTVFPFSHIENYERLSMPSRKRTDHLDVYAIASKTVDAFLRRRGVVHTALRDAVIDHVARVVRAWGRMRPRSSSRRSHPRLRGGERPRSIARWTI